MISRFGRLAILFLSLWAGVAVAETTSLSPTVPNPLVDNSSALTSFVAGTGAGAALTASANHNVILGSGAAGLMTTQVDSVAIGYKALSSWVALAANSQTVAIGSLAAQNMTAGIDGVFIGFAAGINNTGDENTGVGWQTMGSAGLTGGFNSSLGNATLLNLTSGSGNTAIGSDALKFITTGINNTAVGAAALKNAAVGSGGNTAVGVNAMLNYVDTNAAANNVSIGLNSLLGSASSTFNGMVAIGVNAGAVSTTVLNSVFVGFGSGANITTGGGNVFDGYNSGRNFTSVSGGFNNTAIGASAAGTGASGGVGNGSNNTVVGNGAAGLIGNGGSNAVFGKGAAAALTTGSTNLVLGTGVAPTLATGSGNIAIGVNASADLIAAAANTFVLQGNGATAIMSATGINGTPAVTIPGTLNVVGALSNNGTAIGVPYQAYSCAVPLTTGVGASTLTCFMKAARAFTVDNITATVAGTLVTVTPSVFECGTSTTCATPTTIGSGAVTASNTATPITVSSAAVAAGDYIAVELTAGTITSVSVNVQVQMH